MPTLIAQAKLRQATRLTVVDKKISAVLTSAITITCIGAKVKRTIIDLDCVSSISLTAEKLLTIGFSNFTQPGYFQRGQRYQITDLGNADYNLIADTTGVTYQVGSVFTAANTGEIVPSITGVAITGIGGQFTCTATRLVVGNKITITGTFGADGTGSITGYTTEKVYTISAITGSGSAVTGFTLTDQGTAIVTTVGTPTGLTYTAGALALTGRAMLLTNLTVSTLTCKFPTYIRIDLEALGMDSYEGQDCILQLDEGVVIQGNYPSSEFTPNPPEASFMTFRIPKYFRSQLSSSVSSSNLVLRIKQLASSLNSAVSLSAFAQRNPGKLAGLVFSLGSISVIIGKITRFTMSLTSVSNVNAITGFVKTMQASVSSAFATNLTAFRRFRETASSLSMLFDQSYTSIQSRIRFVQSSINVVSDSSVIGSVRVRASAVITNAFASLVATPIKLHSANASLIVSSSVNTTAQRPATYILNAGTGTISFNYSGATNILVEWGDGTTSTLNSASGDSSISKSYSAPEISRTISITGTVTTMKGISSFYSPTSGQVFIAMPTFGDLQPITLDAFTTGVPHTQLPRRLPSSVTTLKMGAGIYTSTEYESWNTVNVTNMSECFSTSGNVLGDITSWNTSNVTNMSRMFAFSAFNQNINGWDVSKVTNMSGMFQQATAFDQSLNSWNTANVTNMSQMFKDANSFNANIYAWNTGSVTDMSEMFAQADLFNDGFIGYWNTANVTNMSGMFDGAFDFNGAVGDWNVSKVTNMQNMFRQAHAFSTSGLNSWNVSNVTNMSGMFQGADNFNHPLNNWNVSNVTTTQNMFAQAEVFQGSLANWQLTKCSNLSGMFSGQNIAGQGYNQPIATWTLGKVTNATSMFENNQMFNQPLDGWGNWMDPAGSCTVNAMFKNAPAFNQSLNGWTTTRMTSCEDMFHSALAFNGNISSWDVSNVTNMRGMFLNTNAFNNNISSWNVSNVTTMLTMFESARAFNQPISSWNTANVTNMSQMFSGATAFNQDLSAWNLYRAPTTGVGPSMSGFWHTSYSYGGAVGISQENYDRTIIGWANKAKAAQIALPGFTGKVVGVPRQVSFGRPTAITGGSTTYGSGVYTTGAAAQTYLSGNPVFVAEGAQWTFTAG